MIPLLILAGAQIYTGLRQAQLIRSQAELNNEIAEYNAENILQDANEAEKYGFTQSARYANTVDGVVSDQRVAEASANVDVNFGTAADLQQEATFTGFLNTLDIQKEARNKAKGLKDQASNVRLGGQMNLAQGYAQAAETRSAAIINGVATGVSGYAKSKTPTHNVSYTGNIQEE